MTEKLIAEKIPRIAIFDIDGTLVRWNNNNYIWEFLLESKTILDLNSDALHQFNLGNISYETWHEKLFQWLLESSLSKNEMMAIIKDNLHPETPSSYLIKKICSNFEHTAILSGSLTLCLEAAGIQNSYFDHILAHHFYFEKDGKITSWDINQYGTDNLKYEGLLQIISKYNLKLSEVLYIGDSNNDIVVINKLNQAGGMGLALPPLATQPEKLFEPKKRLNSLDELLTMGFL